MRAHSRCLTLARARARVRLCAARLLLARPSRRRRRRKRRSRLPRLLWSSRAARPVRPRPTASRPSSMLPPPSPLPTTTMAMTTTHPAVVARLARPSRVPLCPPRVLLCPSRVPPYHARAPPLCLCPLSPRACSVPSASHYSTRPCQRCRCARRAAAVSLHLPAWTLCTPWRRPSA